MVLPSVKVTVPLGAPSAVAPGVTVAVRATVPPKLTVLGVATRAVLVETLPTFCVVEARAGRKWALPE